MDLARFGTWKRLIRVTAFVMRFIKKLRPNFSTISTDGPFSAEDFKTAEILLMKNDQEIFLEDCGEKTLVDKNGIKQKWYYGKMEPNLAQPIMLSCHSPLTTHIIRRIHENLQHGGVDWTLTEFLRSYWCSKARQTVRKVIGGCLKCRRISSTPFAKPEIPPHPTDRVVRHVPFESSGVDYFGPTVTRLAGNVVKVWIVLLTCLTTRAVYLEPTLDLSTTSFTNVVRRFISRRGRPKRMLSDNGGQFVLANKTMNELKKDLIAEELALNGIEWKFLPSLSPWAGGLYERLVGMAKMCFKRALGRKILEYDQLATFTAEVEASLNQRPISHVSGESDAPLPLRPIDFLIPHGTISLNFGSVEEWEDERRLPPERKLAIIWKNTLTVLDTFWEKWSSEYLILLRERSKWKHKGPRLQTMSSPTVGEVVLVEDFRPRNLWPLGKVRELNTSGSVVRSVKVKMANGRIVTRH
uniref:Integrase catalytic domain-containing protein n=1 Tax=Meloidogyne incognita TaxID=6306 RepID=A0A914N5G5_MELIC